MKESPMRTSTILLPAVAVLLAAPAYSQPSATTLPGSFDSIELRGGGMVTVRYGPARQVTVREPNPDRPIRAEGARLVIDRCSGRCSGGHRIHVEVVTPEIARLAVTDGGLLEIRAGFPRQAAVAASVNSGGIIDMRLLEAASVSASVSQGGRILTRPRQGLTAAISDGGNVTYWGDAEVSSSVRRGGAVARGAPADFAAPAVGFERPPPRLPTLAKPPAPPRPPRT
jgi:hypothetical protein